MDKNTWPLSVDHKGQFFNETPDLSKLFAEMSLWTMENDIEAVSVSFDRRYDDDVKDIVHSATIFYLDN